MNGIFHDIIDEMDIGWFLCMFVGFTLAFFLGRHHTGRLLHRAHMDKLTGLPDRTIADQVIRKACDNNTRVTVGVVDVNGLKDINDRLGHAAGDQVLTLVALSLKSAVSLIDRRGMVARLGGDEFLIVTQALESELAHTLEQTHEVSIGLASSPRDGDPRHAIECADIAMYCAKVRNIGILAYSGSMGLPEETGMDLPSTVRRRNGRSPR